MVTEEASRLVVQWLPHLCLCPSEIEQTSPRKKQKDLIGIYY